jgi:hypothetical protein
MNMSCKKYGVVWRLASLMMVLVALNAPVKAATVADTLPFPGSPDWTEIIGSGASMVLNGATDVTLTTANNRGVFFGWGVASVYGNQPAWTPGNSAAGNYLQFDAAFSANAADWSAYVFDRNYRAQLRIAPTGCGSPNNCYGLPGAAGIDFIHAATNGVDLATTFVALDLSVEHNYEFLLKNGNISYRVDGVVVYDGLALPSLRSAPLLVVGDGSGGTQTGRGSMTISGVSFDNAPIADSLATVPLPGPVFLLLGGLLALVPARRRAAKRNGA